MSLKRFLIIIAIVSLLAIPSFATTRTVTNCADAGAGSLKQALLLAGVGDVIVFNITTAEAGYSTGEAGPGLVTNEAGSDTWFRIITTGLGISDDNLVINGSSQPTGEANNSKGPRIELRTSGNGIGTTNSNTTIEGLAINLYTSATTPGGLYYSGAANHNSVYGCYIGITPTGEGAPENTFRWGIYLGGGSYNKIGGPDVGQRNIIANIPAGDGHGIHIESSSSSNEIINNYIGTDRTGSYLLGSSSNTKGVFVASSSYNKIGKPIVNGGNVISGSQIGVYLSTSSNTNEILGNYIGISASGNVAVNKGVGTGAMIGFHCINNKIGDGTVLGRNVISGNGINIWISGNSTPNPGDGAYSNEVKGNFIGMPASGEGVFPGISSIGIDLFGNSQFNIIGGDTTAEGNVIGGNGGCGIFIGNTTDPYNNFNTVKNNWVGVNRSGTKIPNGVGIELDGCGTNEVINNTISGNSGFGIYLYGAQYCEVKGNVIGSISPDFPSGKGNNSDGIYIGDNGYANSGLNKIGGVGSAEANIIVGNASDGVNINGGIGSNEITGNYIGVTPPYYSSSVALPNASIGINIFNSPNNIIGGTIAAAANVISGNSSSGIYISQSGAINNRILGNFIGVDSTGAVGIPNANYGIIFTSGPSQNIVGPSNIIANNGWAGVNVDGSNTNRQLITRNAIYGNNWGGIFLTSGGNNNIATPVIASAFYNTSSCTTEVRGNTAPANGTIEVFKAQGNQGKNYLGSTIADGSGNFTILLTGLTSGDGVAVTGTRSGTLETSQFSVSAEVMVANYQPDLMIGTLETGADYAYEGTWEAYPITQIRSLLKPVNQPAVYYFKAKNAGNVAEYLRITAEAGSGSFEVRYFSSKAGTNEITAAITQEGYTTVVPVAPGANIEGRVEVRYSANTYASREIVMTSVSSNDSNKKDAVKAIVIFAPAIYQPDLMIGTLETGADYAYEGTWESYPITQVRSLLRPANQTEVFYFKLKNAGEMAEYLRISGEASSGSFEVRYFGSKSGADDITGQITGEGMLTPSSLAPGASVEGRVEIRCLSNILATREIIMTSISSFDSAKKDLVKMTATFRPVIYRPDIMIGTLESGADYAYEGVYETTPATQIKRLSVPANGTAVYYYKFYNAGDDADIILSGEAGSGDFTVKYFDEKVDGYDITEILTGEGYLLDGYPAGASAEVRFEVSYAGIAAATKEIVVTFISTNDVAKVDRIKAVTTFASAEFQPDLMIGTLETGADYAYENVYELIPVTQIRTKRVATNETAAFYLKLKNSGQAPEYLRISGEAGPSPFSVRYFDAKSGGVEITHQLTGEGWSTPYGLPVGASLEIRVDVNYSGNITATKEIIMTLTSSHEPNKKDKVKAIAMFNPLPAAPLIDHFDMSVPSSSIAGTPFNAVITAKNSSGSTEAGISGTTLLSVDIGTILPASIDASSFTSGVWTGNITIGKPGSRTITATNGTATGSAYVVVMNASREYTATDLGVIGMHILIPAGVASADVVITVVEVAPPPADPPVGYRFGGKAYDVRCNVMQFSIPLTITFPIDGSLAEPRIYYWSGSSWSRNGLMFLSSNAASMVFLTDHLSIFAPMGAAANNLVRFGPNPYNPNNGSGIFWYWLDSSKDTSIYLIDLGGTLVWKNSYLSGINGAKLGENNISYDGKTSWGDVLGNGVYLYKIVQDSRSIGGGKIAVIK